MPQGVETDTTGWSAEQAIELEMIQQRRRQLEAELAELRTELSALDKEIEEADAESGLSDDPRERQWQAGRAKFNADPAAGVAFLVDEGLLDGAPDSIASYLFNATSLRKRAIGQYFASTQAFNQQVFDSFAAKFALAGKRLMPALREFLGSFSMPGEAQVVERCMNTFAKVYSAKNPDCQLDADRIFLLCYACMMLNTALHNAAAKKDVVKSFGSVDDFHSMLERSSELAGLDKSFVREIYEDVRQQPFVNSENFQDILHSMSHARMEGHLCKQGGKVKTWKRRYCLLQGCQLSYLRDMHTNYAKGVIQLRDLAIRDCQDKSKSFCFELFNPSGDRIEAFKTDSNGKVVAGRHSVYRFSAQSQEELTAWTQALNDAIQENKFFTIKRSLSLQPVQLQ